MIHLAALLAYALVGALLTPPDPWHLVARDDAGTPDAPHLLLGQAYTFPEDIVAGTDSERSCFFGDRVVFGYAGVDPGARYRVALTLASDGERRQQLYANEVAIDEPLLLGPGAVVTRTFELPAECLGTDRLIVELRRLQGPNAVVSRIEVLSTNPAPLTELAPGSFRREQFPVRPPSAEELNQLLPTYRPLPQSTLQAGSPSISLNGPWRMHAEPSEGWYREPAGLVGWSAFEVPGQFVQQGLVFDPREPVACTRSFEVDPAWRAGRTILRFEAVFSHCRVFVNGLPAGEHLGGMTPFELDVSDHVRDGSNDLALEVTSWSDADLLGSLSQYTAHPLGGILRDVTLFTVPALHLCDLRIVTDLDATHTDATLELELELDNSGDQPADELSLGIRIRGTTVDEEPDLPAVAPHSRRRVRLSIPVAAPRLWDPEHPHVYHLQLFLAMGGAELESLVVPFGFREIEVRGEQLLVNGAPVKLRGANRHEVDPLRGRVVDRETCILDAQLLREANCNYVRTSHYPPSADFLLACDYLGLFVEVEAPLGWVGHGANANWSELDHADPRWLAYQRQANLESVHFNRNHPSVLFWSLANESSWTRNFAEVLAAVQVADPSRPQAFHDQAWGGYNSEGSRAPIANMHYPGPGGPAHVAEEPCGRPVLFGEYCHLSVYNRREIVTDPAVRDLWGRALQPMWAAMVHTPGVLGGALWSGIDDVFHLPDGTATGYGPWGLIDGWRRRKPEFLQVRGSYAPVVVLSSRAGGESLRLVELENRFCFTNLEELQILWQSEDDEAFADGPDIAPGERGVVELEAPGTGPLLLTFFDARELSVAEEFIDWPEPQIEPPPERPAGAGFECTTSEQSVIVRGAGLELLLDARTGGIEGLRRDGQLLIAGGPHLLALPLQSDRCAPEYQPALPPLTATCSGWRLEELTVLPGEQEVRIVARGAYDQARGSFVLRLDAAGTLGIAYDFELSAESLVPRQLGVVFDLPRALDTVSWLRSAEWTSYPDDHIGRPSGSAPAFYGDCPEPVAPAEPRDWPWSHDATPLGCNDFRATRSRIFHFELSAPDGRRVRLVGDGTGDARAWIEAGETIRLLAAAFSVPTGEMFARSHFADQIVAWERGARLAGSAELRFP